MEEVLSYLDVFLLVFARMGGMLLTNPIFSRRNIPMRTRTGLVFAFAMLLTPTLDGAAIAGYNGLETMGALVREVSVGVCFGLVFQIFFYMLFVAGNLMDMVFGLSMATVFDPVNGIQSSLTGQLLQILFVLYFFATDSHLILIKIFSYSFELIPIGAYTFALKAVSSFLLSLFHQAFLMMLKLALPFVAAELVVEGAMGILMKLIPQIHVFVINIQCKIVVGLLLLFLFAQPMGNMIEQYIGVLLEDMQQLMTLF